MNAALVGSDLESLLWTGMTEAVFHWSGKVPFEKQSRKRRHNGLASSAAHSFKTLLGTWSGPVALSGLRERRIFVMSLGLKTIFSSKTRGCTVASWGWWCPFSSLHYFAKVWQKMLALSFALVCTVPECSMAGISEWPALPQREFTSLSGLKLNRDKTKDLYITSHFRKRYLIHWHWWDS